MYTREDLSRLAREEAVTLKISDLPDLLEAASDQHRPIEDRIRAIWLLTTDAMIHNLAVSQKRRVVEMLISLMKTDAPGVAWAATLSLGRLDNHAGVKALIQGTAHNAPVELRLACVHALGLTGSNAAIQALVSILRAKNESAQIRSEAAEALAFCGKGSHDAYSALIDVLNDPAVEVRFFAVYALGFIGDLNSVSALQGRRSDSGTVSGYGSVKDEVEKAIGQIRSRRSQD